MPAKTIYTVPYRRLVERLRVIRESAGLSQSDLARKLAWPQQRISAIEAGARRVDVLEFFSLTKALGLPSTAASKLVIELLEEN